MMVPLIKNAHPAESNEISQPEITSREEMLPTHSASRVAPTNPSAIAQLSDGYGQIAEEPVHNGSTRAERFDNSQTSGLLLVNSRGEGSRTSSGPPIGRWRDGLFDCLSNIFPSCICSLCCMGSYAISRVAHTTKLTHFMSIMLPFLAVYVICSILTMPLPYQSPNGQDHEFWLIPFFGLIIVSVFLRIHFMRTYEIPSSGCLTECCTVLWCMPCSTAQMFRHLGGYTKIFDGDSDPTIRNEYDRQV